MTFNTVRDFERGRWDRPKVKPPDGSRKVEYTRCTTFVDALDSKYALSLWQQRMVAVGMSQRKDLLLGIAALAPSLMLPTDDVPDDAKEKANELCEKALEAAQGRAAATTGTALHAMTQHLDLGHPLGVIPDEARADLEAYRRATAPLTALHIEQPMVHDGFKIGGTPDRIVEYGGDVFIADVKTGSIQYAALKIAMQLAVYAHSTIYDVTIDRRLKTPDINKRRAIVIHLPAGKAQCTLLSIDIDRGWRAVQTASQVRNWRSAGDWMKPLEVEQPSLLDEQPVNLGGGHEAAEETQQRLADAIALADSVTALTDLWALNRDVWTDDLTGLATNRKAALQSVAS